MIVDMNTREQVRILTDSSTLQIPSFAQRLQKSNLPVLTATAVDIFQMNVGKLCNLQCKHCHVEAGPTRTENMDRHTFEQCLKVIKENNISTIDLTGGAPEMNPNLEWFLNEVSPLSRRIIVRSNLTVLKIPKYAHFLDVFTDVNVEVVASLPSYDEASTDRQRGNTVFKNSINILQELNNRGYGKSESPRVLNLVHNPTGAYLPGSQQSLESEYKRRLKKDFDIDFNNLFTITNLPISRYLDYLIDSGNYEDYMTELVNAFNPAAVENVMCRNTISVGYDGQLYDCDFNQMLDLPLGFQSPTHISEYSAEKINGRRIVINNHCYGCTAGAGSSCQGSLE
jgi:radical SAM/Cys-rich protein